jgi:hypothetical protein
MFWCFALACIGLLWCCCNAIGCHLCSGTKKIPNYLNLILSDAVDFNCGLAEGACDNEPSPLSPLSSLNGTHILNYDAELTGDIADSCIAWYKSDPFPYGDFLASTLGSPDCIVASGYTITFAAEVVFVAGPPVDHVTLYTFIFRDEDGTEYFDGVTITEPHEDHSWMCDPELTSDPWENPAYDFTATTGDGYPDAYNVRFSLGYCWDIRISQPVTVRMSRSVGDFTP